MNCAGLKVFNKGRVGWVKSWELFDTCCGGGMER